MYQVISLIDRHITSVIQEERSRQAKNNFSRVNDTGELSNVGTKLLNKQSSFDKGRDVKVLTHV